MNTYERNTTYQNLCAEYYDLDKPVANQLELEFYHFYIKKSSGPLLEPMCGTGRFLIPLLEKGYSIEGFDASTAMLNALYEKCREKNLTPSVWQQFLQDFNPSKKYGLIFIPNGSFCLLTDASQALHSLERIYTYLIPGGIFVFEVMTHYSIPKEFGVWHGSVQTRLDGKKIILSTLSLPMRQSVGTTLCRYELVEHASVLKTEIETFKVRFYDSTIFHGVLKNIGFRSVILRKAYSHDEQPHDKDNVVIYECIK